MTTQDGGSLAAHGVMTWPPVCNDCGHAREAHAGYNSLCYGSPIPCPCLGYVAKKEQEAQHVLDRTVLDRTTRTGAPRRGVPGGRTTRGLTDEGRRGVLETALAIAEEEAAKPDETHEIPCACTWQELRDALRLVLEWPLEVGL